MGMDLDAICKDERDEGWRMALLAAQDAVREVWRTGIGLTETNDAIRALPKECPDEVAA